MPDASFYPLIPLIACLTLGILATAIVMRDPSDRANRLAALLVASTAFWSFCEVLWNVQRSPEIALAWVRVSAPGWVFIGPLMLALCLEVTGRPSPRVRALMPWLNASAAGLVGITWLTPWMQSGVERTSWGWAYLPGPLYPVYYALTLGCVLVALGIGWRVYRHSASPAERAQGRLLAAGLAFPLVVGSLTDGILPMLGIQPMRLATASFSVMAGAIAWSLHRYGFSLLAPGGFASHVLQALPDGVALLRPDGSIRSANATMARLLEGTSDDLLGLLLTERIADFDPGLESDLIDRRCELTTLTDRRVPVSISAKPLRDLRGEPLGFALVVRDQAEVVSLRNRLELSGRLAAVGQLAAGIAHEINNPLAFVRSNLGVLRMNWQSLGEELQKSQAAEEAYATLAESEELIDESIEGVDRAVSIVREVRSLSHTGGGSLQRADLHSLLDGVLRVASPQLRGRVDVRTDYGTPVHLLCAPQELQQVFLNLVLNAAQAIHGEGKITVSSEMDGTRVEIRVEDDGCGIEPEVIERIFDPFFTTKAVGEGTGLGLGIAYEIVRRHGGDILVSSEPGRGSCFRVTLPVGADTIPSRA